MEESSGFLSCEKVDRVASWVGAGVATAFFASLERCSCINLSTTDDDVSAEEAAAKDHSPLMLTKPMSHNFADASAAASAAAADKIPPV